MKKICFLSIVLMGTPLTQAKTIELIRGDGTSSSHQTIQAALTAAKPGDTVRIGEGVYHENIYFPNSGAPGKPIILEGTAGTILDGSDATLQTEPHGKWTAVTQKEVTYYRAKVPFSPGEKVNAVGTWISRYNEPGSNGCDRLLAAYGSIAAMIDAPRGEGSYREGETVYVKLANGQDPNTVGLNVGTAQGVIFTNGKSHLQIRNLEVRNSGWAGVVLGPVSGAKVEATGTKDADEEKLSEKTDYQNVTLKGVTVRNCFRGVSCGTLRGQQVVISGCRILNGIGDNWKWAGGYIAGVGSGAKSRSDSVSPWRGFGLRLVNLVDSEISNCLVSGQWDGMGVKNSLRVRIHHNTIRSVMDDGIELESANQAYIEFYNNHIYDAFAGVSVTSDYPGPFYIYRNVVEVTRPGGKGDKSPSYCVKSGEDSLQREENIKFYHNTFWTSGSYNVWEKIGDAAPDHWHGYDFVNNVMCAPGKNYNFRGIGKEEAGVENHWESNLYSQDKPEEPGALTAPDLASQFENATSENKTTPRDLRLKESSAGRNSASDYPQKQGWPDSVTDYPGGRNRGAWEDGMKPGDIGAPAEILSGL